MGFTNSSLHSVISPRGSFTSLCRWGALYDFYFSTFRSFFSCRQCFLILIIHSADSARVNISRLVVLALFTGFERDVCWGPLCVESLTPNCNHDVLHFPKHSSLSFILKSSWRSFVPYFSLRSRDTEYADRIPDCCLHLSKLYALLVACSPSWISRCNSVLEVEF